MPDGLLPPGADELPGPGNCRDDASFGLATQPVHADDEPSLPCGSVGMTLDGMPVLVCEKPQTAAAKMFFEPCCIRGCDASTLLEGTKPPRPTTEPTGTPAKKP